MPFDTKLTSRCLANATDDEPIFVLRGNDRLTPAMIRIWAATLRHSKGNASKIQQALTEADEIEIWQKAHPERVKLPD